LRTLRIQIALFMLVAIVVVVGIATAVTVAVISNGEPERLQQAYAQQLATAAELLRQQGALADKGPIAFGVLQDQPATGIADNAAAEGLRRALGRSQPNFQPLITATPNGDYKVSLPVGESAWLVMPFARPPEPPWGVLADWILMIVIGAAAVAFLAAQRIVRPLGVIENAVASVEPDGLLPEIPEQGASEIRETAAALNRLSARLKTAIESRMRLVAAAGHDLRTPMTRMRLRTEFLPEEERHEWLADIDELDLIADSAIRLVKEEAAGADRQAIPLAQLVWETVEELRQAEFKVKFHGAQAMTVRAGALALKRALRNLIINAATHGGGARVTLERQDGLAAILIEDDGPGIPDDLIEQMFEPFFRPDPARRRTVPGAGLGLAIAREIIERFGGRIEIANRPEGGLRQKVTLPIA